MRSIEGNLPDILQNTTAPLDIGKSDGHIVDTFRQLVELVAATSYFNKDYLLFFRGQSKDYKNKAGKSTFYPTIYRGDYLQQREVNYRFEILAGASNMLVKRFIEENITGKEELRRKRLIQWSVLQHYEVCATPLLDFTHSLRVAASFAQLDTKDDYAYIYVFGLPYLTNRISNNSEHDIVTVRLLSICPPEAIRPYFQEGYVAGTEDIENYYDNKTELDFNNRLIAKLRIPTTKSFWGSSFNPIPKTALYPKADKIQGICNEIGEDVKRDLQPGQIGEFLKGWAEVEVFLMNQVNLQGQNVSALEAIRRAKTSPSHNKELFYLIDRLRRFRNQLVHSPIEIGQDQIRDYLKSLDDVRDMIKQIKS